VEVNYRAAFTVQYIPAGQDQAPRASAKGPAFPGIDTACRFLGLPVPEHPL